VQVVSRQLEEGVGDLQHQDVGMVMFVTNKNAFASSSHSMSDIVLFEALKACQDRGVFFRLSFLGAEGIVREGIEADCIGLVAVE